jgi:membrane protein implicated in regulation of membrane protease activity
MGFRADIGNISKDALEFLKRSVDGCKLRIVENLSLLLGDVICGFVLFMLLFVAYLALMVAIMILLLPLIGLPLSIVVVALLLLLTAMIVYMLRERLFVDGIVRHLSKMFFEKSGENGKKEM